jgi:ABC-type branched-subunit amino acid transport system substrate-binding protein
MADGKAETAGAAPSSTTVDAARTSPSSLAQRGRAGRRGARARRTRRTLALALAAAATVVTVVVVALALAGPQGSGQSADACPGRQGLRVDPGTGGCWGVSDGSAAFQSSNRALAQVEGVIAEQDREARADHLLQPRRPLVVLAYLGRLTSRDDQPNPLVAERETLEGVAATQRLYLERSTPDAPVVEVLLANEGADLAHATDVVRLLDQRTAPDGPVVGVVGLDQSRQPTADAIDALGRLGIPTVAAALSADSLSGRSSLYFQVAPRNQREAAVGAAYIAAHTTVRSALVFSSADRSDLYSENLADDMTADLRERGFAVTRSQFRPAGLDTGTAQSADEAGRKACAAPGFVYYSGRAEEFDDFLHRIYVACGSTPPQILADDDVSRYVAAPDLRTKYRSIPFQYASFAIAPATCQTRAQDTFYAILDEIFPSDCATEGAFLDGHAALGYDAALTMLTAAESVEGPVTRAALARALPGVEVGGAASGPVAMGTDGAPVDKLVAILTIAHGQPPGVDGACGKGAPRATWCPPPPASVR